MFICRSGFSSVREMILTKCLCDDVHTKETKRYNTVHAGLCACRIPSVYKIV